MQRPLHLVVVITRRSLGKIGFIYGTLCIGTFISSFFICNSTRIYQSQISLSFSHTVVILILFDQYAFLYDYLSPVGGIV